MSSTPPLHQELIDLAVSAGTSALLRLLENGGTTTFTDDHWLYEITVRRHELPRPPPAPPESHQN